MNAVPQFLVYALYINDIDESLDISNSGDGHTSPAASQHINDNRSHNI
jgi:hypothetical protein